MTAINRRTFLRGAAAGLAVLAAPRTRMRGYAQEQGQEQQLPDLERDPVAIRRWAEALAGHYGYPVPDPAREIDEGELEWIAVLADFGADSAAALQERVRSQGPIRRIAELLELESPGGRGIISTKKAVLLAMLYGLEP